MSKREGETSSHQSYSTVFKSYEWMNLWNETFWLTAELNKRLYKQEVVRNVFDCSGLKVCVWLSSTQPSSSRWWNTQLLVLDLTQGPHERWEQEKLFPFSLFLWWPKFEVIFPIMLLCAELFWQHIISIEGDNSGHFREGETAVWQGELGVEWMRERRRNDPPKSQKHFPCLHFSCQI